MYLKSLKLENFRKFSSTDNVVEFVDSNHNINKSSDKEVSLASSTTLIVGKNNTGKTTVTKALNKLCRGDKFTPGDFNFMYLNELLEQYKGNDYKNEPFIEFKVKIGIEFSSEDLINNVVHFLDVQTKIQGENTKDLEITIKHELAETLIFKEKTKKILDEYRARIIDIKKKCKKYEKESEDINCEQCEKEILFERKVLFEKFLQLIDKSEFKRNYYGINGEEIKENKFKLSQLIDIKVIEANKNLDEKCLSGTFNKLIKYRYESAEHREHYEKLEDEISNMNRIITREISNNHTANINSLLYTVESGKDLQVDLSSDLTFDKLMNNLIRYEYLEEEFNIPEGQYGLGYSNLMFIISSLIDHVDKYQEDAFKSKINLICIEEPETFMHPQMQELFIKYIDDGVKNILSNTGKKINSQLIITTHSSHILNSKIHSGDSFNNINYITEVDKYCCVVNLNDNKVKDSDGRNEFEEESEEEFKNRRLNELKFLKKHIKYKVSELFFSDAVIFVEGVTEEVLLSYYIDSREDLKKYYISIFNINGAHGHIYHNLIKLLKVPCLIITDLDIKRNKEQKKSFKPIVSLNDETTTNKTIIKYNKTDLLDNLEDKFEIGNLYVTFQDKIEDRYPTSFEESFILTNYKNDILNRVLSIVKPEVYKKIINNEKKELDQLKEKSYELQYKLSKSKSDFANTMLYELVTSENKKNQPELPGYITKGLDWLSKCLNGGN